MQCNLLIGQVLFLPPGLSYPLHKVLFAKRTTLPFEDIATAKMAVAAFCIGRSIDE